MNVQGGTVFNSGTVVNGGVDVFGTGTYTQTAGTTSGGLTNNNIVNANGGAINGIVNNNAGGTFNVGGTVTGDFTFNNSAATSRLLVNSGSYTVAGLVTNSGTNAAGGILVAAGATLNANGGITNNAGATIVNNGTVNDVLNNAGVVTNNLNYNANVATNTGTITNSATGTWTGNVIGNAGNATGITNNGVWSGNVQANTGTITNNLLWSGTVSTGGIFDNTANGVVSGLLTNTAGTTTNDGTLNGATVNGGTLTGQGLINGATTVASGGTFAPGNATPGTSMALTGSLALQSGAFYLVQINPATSSLANVTGTATLGGATVKANFTNGSYVDKQYLILHTTAGVTGTFDPTVVNTNLPVNFGTSLSYSATDVFLNLTAALGAQQSLSANQRNVANAINNFFNNGGGPISPGFAALFGLTGSNLSSALTQGSGETATGSQQTTFNAMTQFLGVLLDPFIDGRGAPAAPPSGAAPYAEEEPLAYASRKRTSAERDAYAMFTKAPLAKTYDPRWSVWAAGFGGSQTTDGNAAQGSNNTTSRIFGMAAGADYHLLAAHHRRFCAGRRRHQFQRRQWRHRPLRPVPGRRVRPAHRGRGLYLRRAGLWLAGHHHRSHRDDRRHRSVAGALQRQRLLGPRRRRLSFCHAVDGRHRHHALRRRAVHDLRSAGLRRAGVVGRQHLCAGLRREERDRHPQRTRPSHRQIIRDAKRRS